MNEFVPPYIEQVPTSTLQRTLEMYEEMLDVLEDMPGGQLRLMRQDVLRAREIVETEVVRRRSECTIQVAEAV